MIIRTVQSSSLSVNQRIDSRYFCSAGTQAHERLAVIQAAGVSVARLGGPTGLAKIWAPNRFTRAYASAAENALPYLRPYDVFEYLPQAADYLSVERTKNVDHYRVSEGTILQSCSGRNLGPAVIVDSYLARFILSHDMIRVEIEDAVLSSYVLAYLNTPTAQALLRRDKTGSVIDHISPSHVEDLDVPLLDLSLRADVAKSMRKAVELRSKARLQIEACLQDYVQGLPTTDRSRPLMEGWTLQASELANRLDAARYDPWVTSLRIALQKKGGGELGHHAGTNIPGRYVRFYVGEGFGTPIMSGRQLLQIRPVNLQYISERSFKDPTKYELRAGWIAMQGEGRAEERIGFPVLIAPDRNGWLANNHVLRVIPKKGVEPGSLFLAMATPHAQAQVKALATGSVVDAVNPNDLERIILPPFDDRLGKIVTKAWRQFSAAQTAENEAVGFLESAMSTLAGEVQLPVSNSC